MRFGVEYVGLPDAFLVVAVTPTSPITPPVLDSQFRETGFEVKQQPSLARNHPEDVIVFQAYRSSIQSQARPGAGKTLIVLAAMAMTWSEQLRTSTATYPRPASMATFQPVWSVSAWSPTGLELLVLDDNDACRQLDGLAECLGCSRDHLTIKPTHGWQRYGHPDVRI